MKMFSVFVCEKWLSVFEEKTDEVFFNYEAYP